MQRRLLIIHNPNAGGSRHALLGEVIRRLHALDWGVTLRQAGCDRTAKRIAHHLAHEGAFDVIVAAGGDGTIRSVAAGLRGSAVPLGIIPLGTGNVMAHEIGLRRNAQEIAAYLTGGCWMAIRGALANGEPFFLMAGVGLDASTVAALNPALKRWAGKLAYVFPLLKAFLAPLPRLNVQVDGNECRASWAVICKASHFAGGFVLSPGSSILIPGLSIVMSTARTRAGLLADMLAVGIGRPLWAPNLIFRRCQKAAVRASDPVAVQVDGESFGTTPLEVCEDSAEVRLLLPAKAQHAAKILTRAAA